jgi:hypothetical protein
MGKGNKHLTEGVEGSYLKIGDKYVGSHSAYYAKKIPSKNRSNKKSENKIFYIKDAVAHRYYPPDTTVHTENMAHELINEALASPFYRAVLGAELAPKVSIISPDDPTHLPKLVSKLLDSTESLLEKGNLFPHDHPNFVLGENQKNLKNLIDTKQIIGFENAIASCILLGDTDGHTSNLIVKQNGQIAKIDHGCTFRFFQFNPDGAIAYRSVVYLFRDYARVDSFGIGRGVYSLNLFRNEIFADTLLKLSQLNLKAHSKKIYIAFNNVQEKFKNYPEVFNQLYFPISGKQLQLQNSPDPRENEINVKNTVRQLKQEIYDRINIRKKEIYDLGVTLKCQTLTDKKDLKKLAQFLVNEEYKDISIINREMGWLGRDGEVHYLTIKEYLKTHLNRYEKLYMYIMLLWKRITWKAV